MGQMICKLAASAVLVRIGWIDYRTMEIPDLLTAILGVFALADLAFFLGPSLAERGIGAICIALPMFLVCRMIPDAFGDGDILLLAVMGFYLGWKGVLAGVFTGFLIGGMEAFYLLGTGKVRWGEKTHVAFGPALCAGLIIALFYGDTMVSWYLGLFY